MDEKVAGANQTEYTFIQNLLEQVTDIPDDSIVSRTIYKDEKVKMILFGFAPGQELSEHTASVPAVIQILQGECSLTLGKDKQEAQAGTWTYMTAKLPHSLVAKTRVVMLLVMLQ
jgi:quercetin dioxygenase-like cupin family protein